jgi:hypothetical protein
MTKLSYSDRGAATFVELFQKGARLVDIFRTSGTWCCNTQLRCSTVSKNIHSTLSQV